MAYRIEYGPMPKVVRPKARSLFRIHILTAVFLLLFVLLVRQAWPEGADMLRACLLPGEPGVADQAVQVFLTDVREGEPIGDAVTALCRQIIENGEAPGN